MELSTLEVGNNYVKEIERWRIPAPGANDTYCEKNWMPILDMPYHYVKWSNPLEIVKVDPVNKTCETIIQKEQKIPYYYRGGSQVIKLGEYGFVYRTLCICLEVRQIRKMRYIVTDLLSGTRTGI